MTPTEILPLLVIVVLLMSAGGGDIDSMEVVFDGDRTVSEIDDALVVGGATVTVPANASISGSIYIIGGDTRIEGAVDGDVTQLAGNLSVADGSTITGELQTIAGQWTIADGADIGQRTTVEFVQQERSPLGGYVSLVLRMVSLAILGGLLARRWPTALRNVGDSITEHTVVSAVVGSLAGASLLVLFVYMAFTLILIPVSILGLLAELLAVVYSYAAFGYLVGRRLPVERVDLASAAGVTIFVLAVELLALVPVIGALAQIGLVTIGFGAVIITYFGLREFEPVAIPS